MKETAKYYINVLISLIFVFCFRFIPAPAPITEQGMMVIGIFIGVIWGLATCDVVWPALLGMVCLGFVGENTVTGVFASAFGSDTWLLVVFIVAFIAVITNAGISDSIAKWICGRKFAKGRPYMVMFLILTAAYVVSAFCSVTPAIFICWEISYVVCRQFGYSIKDKYDRLLVMGVIVAAEMGQSAFPFKAIAVSAMGILAKATGETANFAAFCSLAIPITYGITLLFVAVSKYIIRPDVSAIEKSEYVYSADTKLSTYQKQVVVLLVVFFILMFVPSTFTSLKFSAICKRIGNTAICALLLGLSLMLRKKDGTPFATFGDTIKAVPWSTMMLVAFNIVMSANLTAEGTGVKAAVTTLCEPLMNSGFGSAIFIIIMIVAAAVLTNFLANMIVASILIPIVATCASAIGVSGPMMATVISVMVGLALFLPCCCPQAALLHGNDEWITAKDIYKWSPIIVFAGIVLAIVLTFTIGMLVF